MDMTRALATEKGANRYRIRRFRSRPTLSIIHSPREFQEIITHECERANRYHSRFSLAVFEVGIRNEKQHPSADWFAPSTIASAPQTILAGTAGE